MPADRPRGGVSKVPMEIKVEGIGKIVGKLTTLTALPMKHALTRAGMIVEKGAKERVHADVGRLRNSITYVVDPSPIPTFVQVGTNVFYAPFVHEGRKPGKMPPVSALEPWAKKHGLNAWAVAISIMRHGIKPNPFLKDALEAGRGEIVATLKYAAEEIKARWRD
jgi:hypothetical protein